MDRETLSELFDYDPQTGVLAWKRGGRPAAAGVDGYVRVKVAGRTYLAHRIAWLLHFGNEPVILDHVDGDRSNNRIANLREVGVTDNNRNMRRRKDNASGCTGVDFEKTRLKWRAQIAVRGKDINLGRFDTFDEAVAARKAAERQYGFHDNHGRGHQARSALIEQKGERDMTRAPECKDRCQYAADVSMPEYQCANVCQYAGRQQPEEPQAGLGPCPHCFESSGYAERWHPHTWDEPGWSDADPTRPCPFCEGTGSVEMEDATDAELFDLFDEAFDALTN